MKHIGFIDYYIDEWHANNYPEWIRDNIAEKGLDMELSYAWAEMDKLGGLDTKSWCKKYDMECLDTIEELVEKSDYIIVLSPDNPENHEGLSELALKSGKPVYIDKTFSPDLSSGKRMFDLAEKHGTPMFSSSALRFSQELLAYPDAKVNRDNLEYVATTGPGEFENYSVHQLEMIVSLMGVGARRVKSLSTKNANILLIEYRDGRRASMFQTGASPFNVTLQLKDGDSLFIEDCTNTFPMLIDGILTFFQTGIVPVPKEQTLEIMAILEAGTKAIQNYDAWIDLPR